MAIELWHCHNARSFRALWALEELGLRYELRMLPFPPRAHDRSYLDVNPLGTIPFLRDGATEMTESCAILDYLARRHGDGGLSRAPEDPEFGAYLNWLHHGEATLTFPQTITLRYGVFEAEDRQRPEVAEDYRVWFLSRLKRAEAALSDGRAHLLPSGFSMADISVAYAVQLAHDHGLENRLPDGCRAWVARLAERPAFRAAQAVEDEAAEAAGLTTRRRLVPDDVTF